MKKREYAKEVEDLARIVLPVFQQALLESHQEKSKKESKKRLEFLRTEIQKAKENGILETKFEGRNFQAMVFTYNETEQFFGVKSQPWVMICRPGDQKSYRWIVNRMKDHDVRKSKDSNIFLPSAYKAMIPSLERLGFSIDSLILDGKVDSALKRLVLKKNPPLDLSLQGLQIRRMKKADIPSILKINKEEFSRNPQFGWFAASPKFLKQHKKDLNRVLKNRDHSHYVIVKRKKVLGHFGSDARSGDVRTGVSLTFARELQGKGVAKTAYRILLTDLKSKNVKFFRGGTSQPAVMNLGHLMDRKLAFIILRMTKGFFPKKHFSVYLG